MSIVPAGTPVNVAVPVDVTFSSVRYPTVGLSYDSLASRIRAQVPELMQKHRAKNIEFKVVIKGGKAILKAVPHT